MRKRLLGSILAAALVPAAASAESCLEELAPRPDQDATLEITTMNRQGVVSYATAWLAYTPPIYFWGARWRAGYWQTMSRSPAPTPLQLFSDRYVLGQNQRFAVGQADRIAASISEDASPWVQLTFLSRSNAQVGFYGTCSANGVIYGSSGDLDILVSLVHRPRFG